MNARDEARLDISARGFGTKYQMGLFDVRVLETNAKKWRKNRQKMERKRKYNKRILQVENGSFDSLVFSVNSTMGKEANKCYSRINEKLDEN